MWIKSILNFPKFNILEPPPNKQQINKFLFIHNNIIKIIERTFILRLFIAIYIGYFFSNLLYNYIIENYDLIIYGTILISIIAAAYIFLFAITILNCLCTTPFTFFNALKEISEDSDISDALYLSDTYPEINAYRIAVLSGGRTLLEGDLMAMKQFEKNIKYQTESADIILNTYKKQIALKNKKRLLTI